jgi:hypothetical protein
MPNSSKESNIKVNNTKERFTNYTVITVQSQSKENISINKLDKNK